MSPELEQKLVEAAPTFLKDYNGDEMQTCMAWGMECDDGWFDLLMDCVTRLEEINRKSKGCVYASQIKQKFGMLTIYYFTQGLTEEENDLVQQIVYEAEEKSEGICEQCGKPATVVTQGWISHLCDDCYNAKRKS